MQNLKSSDACGTTAVKVLKWSRFKVRKCAPEESIAVKKIKNATLRKLYNLIVFGHKATLLNTYLTHISCRVLEGLSAAGLVGCGVGVCGCFVVLLPEEYGFVCADLSWKRLVSDSTSCSRTRARSVSSGRYWLQKPRRIWGQETSQ